MDEQNTQPLPSTRTEQEVAAKVQPSGYRGEDPSTAGPGPTGVQSSTPENSRGGINPSAPANTGTTPDTTAER